MILVILSMDSPMPLVQSESTVEKCTGKKRIGTAIEEPSFKRFRNGSKDHILQQSLMTSYPKLYYRDNEILRRRPIMEHFSHEISTPVDIADQNHSGRCWMFAQLEPMRVAMINKYNLHRSFKFSTSWLAFWDKFEKVRTNIRIAYDYRHKSLHSRVVRQVFYCGDGGWYDYLETLVGKYGLVPKSVFGETLHSKNTCHMNKELYSLLVNYIYKVRALDEEDDPEELFQQAENDVFKLLSYFLGTPPKKFSFRYEERDDMRADSAVTIKKFIDKMYTPKTFYEELVPHGKSVVIINDTNPDRSYNQKHLGYHNVRNVYEAPPREYLNLKMSELKDYMKRSINAGIPVPISCDVSAGNYYHNTRGVLHPKMYHPELLLPSLKETMSKHERCLYYKSSSNHVMSCTGYDKATGTWKINNSWGSGNGNGGYWMAYDSWIDEYVYDIEINKDLLDDFHKDIIDGPAAYQYRWADTFI